MTEETWYAARLIPTSGIKGADEQERRATSALLAVMESVREFGRAITVPLGAPAGNLECFIEVPFDLDGKRVQPDGLIRVTRGAKKWVALVEVKTAGNDLGVDQLHSYLDVARSQGFDALLTISNQIAPAPGGHPTDVDKRKLKSVQLHHLSWTEVLTTAVMQKVHRGVADPDQAWILQELIRYLEHERSGAMEFGDMGPSWTTVRDALTAGTLRPTDEGLLEVVGRFDQLLHYASLRLGKKLGIEVQLALSKREQGDPRVRAELLADSLVRTGTMSGSLRIPNTVGPVRVTADLRAGRVSTSIDVDAPRTGKPVTRVNWLVRQLKDAQESVRIDALAQYERGPGASELLETVRTDPNVLVKDAKRELKTFHVSHSCPAGTKRARGRGSFIDSVLACLDGFYESTVQVLKPWSAPPPKLRSEELVVREPTVAPSLPSTSISSQDGTENATPTPPATSQRMVG